MLTIVNRDFQESLLFWAKKYAQMGLRVIPLRGKIPSVSHGVTDATCDIDTISRWFGKGTTNTGIGIATGANESDSVRFIVLDADCDQADKFLQKTIDQTQNTWRVRTGSGGIHYYFQTKLLLKNSQNILSRIPGASDGKHSVDVRGAGGYVVAPPSKHPDGGVYEWECDLDHTQMQWLPTGFWDIESSGDLFRKYWPAERAKQITLPENTNTTQQQIADASDPVWDRRRKYVLGAISKICSQIATAGSGTPRHNTAFSCACKIESWIKTQNLMLNEDEIESQILQAMMASKPQCTKKDQEEYVNIVKSARKIAVPVDESQWQAILKDQPITKTDETDFWLNKITWPKQDNTPAIEQRVEEVTSPVAQSEQNEQSDLKLPSFLQEFIDACDPDHARGTAALGIACIVLSLCGCSVYSRGGSILAAPTRVQEHHFLAEPSMGKTYLTSLIKRIAKDMSSEDQPIAIIDALANSREALEDLIGAELFEKRQTEDGKVEIVARSPLPHILILWDEFAAQTADQIRQHDMFAARRQAFVNLLQSGEFQPSRSRANSKNTQWPSVSGLNVCVVSMDQIKNGKTLLMDTSAEGASRRRALWSIECNTQCDDNATPAERAFQRACVLRSSFREDCVLFAARKLREKAIRGSAIDLPELTRNEFCEVFDLCENAADGYRPYRAVEFEGSGLASLKIEYFALLCAKACGKVRVDLTALKNAASVVKKISQTERALFSGENETCDDDREFEKMFDGADPRRRQQAYEPWRFLARLSSDRRRLAAFRDFALRRVCLQRSDGRHFQFCLLSAENEAQRCERIDMPVYRAVIDGIDTSSRANFSRSLRAALFALALPPEEQNQTK